MKCAINSFDFVSNNVVRSNNEQFAVKSLLCVLCTNIRVIMPENNSMNLEQKLLSMETIFKWRPTIFEENLQDVTCEFEPQSENEFNFYNFVIRLIRCYNEKNDDSALKILNELETSANHFNEDGEGGLFERIKNAYFHVVYASKIYLLIKNNKAEAEEIVKKIKSCDELDGCNQAAISAMKSAVFALGSTEDSQKVTTNIEKALKQDGNALWYFLKGLYSRKTRKITHPFEPPSLLEREMFEQAFEKEPTNVVFKLHVADVFRESYPHASKRSNLCSHFLPKDISLTENLKVNIDKKIQQAANYYKEAANAYPESPYVMFRAADGLAKLPEGLNDIKQAKKLTKDGLKLSPDNVSGNLVQAFLYEKFDKNIDEAIKHLAKCQEKNIFEAEMNMIRILHSTKPKKINGIEILETLLEKYEEKPRKAALYSQMVSYYIFVKYDIVKANESATNFYKLCTESSLMRVHRSCFIASMEPFKLIDVLLDEIKHVMDDADKPKELEDSCKKFVHFMNFQNIPIMKGFYQNFRQQILSHKPMTVNQNLVDKPHKKFDQANRGGNKRGNNTGRGDFRNGPKSQSTNRPNPSNRANNNNNNNNNNRPNNQGSTGGERVPPQLMDLAVPKPAPKKVGNQSTTVKPPEPLVENDPKRGDSKENDGDPSVDADLEERIRNLLKNRDDDDSDPITKILKALKIDGKKKSSRKKRYSDSDTDSDHRRRRDRRRDHSRRRHRRSRSDSDDSDRHSRRHRRRKHYSSDSEDSSRSAHRTKSHRKDRHDRDRHRRRHHSSDDDYNYSRSSYRRDDSVSPDRRRRNRKDSVSSRATRDRSVSYERRHKKHESSRRRRSISSVSSVGSRRRSPNRSPCDEKSRRPSLSRDKRDSQRNAAKSQKETKHQVDQNESSRQLSSALSRQRSVSPTRRRKDRKNSVSSVGSRDRSTSVEKYSRGSKVDDKKSRRRSSSRDKHDSRKSAKSKNEQKPEIDENDLNRELNSALGRQRSISPSKRKQDRRTSVSSAGSRDRSPPKYSRRNSPKVDQKKSRRRSSSRDKQSRRNDKTSGI